MIAKIGKSGNLYGALAYNNIKVANENGKILMVSKMMETRNGKYTVAQLARSFEPYLVANRNTEKHTLHISLNPDPKDKVSDENFCELAERYMQQMGYGEQPYVVFKHTDIDRTHIHIVSVCVDELGKKISDKFEKIRSMKICRELEKQYGLIPATDKERAESNMIFHPVNYKAGNVKKQIASVIQTLPNHYKFQTLGEYNALLSLFNITCEKIESELPETSLRGLIYFSLNEKSEKVGNPFKASLFGKNKGIIDLETHFNKSKLGVKDHLSKQTLKAIIDDVLKTTNDEIGFKKHLIQQGINVVVRRNDADRLYGITFIDHNTKMVWNGSRLGKEYAANVFNDLWNCNTQRVHAVSNNTSSLVRFSNDIEDVLLEKAHALFDFLNSDIKEYNTIETLGGLLPETLGEDYEELDFAQKMKKRKYKKR